MHQSKWTILGQLQFRTPVTTREEVRQRGLHHQIALSLNYVKRAKCLPNLKLPNDTVQKLLVSETGKLRTILTIFGRIASDQKYKRSKPKRYHPAIVPPIYYYSSECRTLDPRWCVVIKQPISVQNVRQPHPFSISQYLRSKSITQQKKCQEDRNKPVASAKFTEIKKNPVTVRCILQSKVIAKINCTQQHTGHSETPQVNFEEAPPIYLLKHDRTNQLNVYMLEYHDIHITCQRFSCVRV